MLAGLREATGDYLVLMDADLQHPPTLLPRMYRILRDSGGALDLCGARRRGRAGEGKIRACLSRGFYKVWNRLTGMETASGLPYDAALRGRRDPATGGVQSLYERHLCLCRFSDELDRVRECRAQYR